MSSSPYLHNFKTHKFAVFNIVLDAIFIVVRAAILIGLLAFRKQPEIKARGLVPHFATTTKILGSIITIIVCIVVLVVYPCYALCPAASIQEAEEKMLKPSSTIFRAMFVIQEVFFKNAFLLAYLTNFIKNFYLKTKHQSMYRTLADEGDEQSKQKESQVKVVSNSIWFKAWLLPVVTIAATFIFDVPQLAVFIATVSTSLAGVSAFVALHGSLLLVLSAVCVGIFIWGYIVMEVKSRKLRASNEEALVAEKCFDFEKYFVDDDPMYVRFEGLTFFGYMAFSLLQVVNICLLMFVAGETAPDTNLFPFYYLFRIPTEILHMLTYGGIVVGLKLDQFLKVKRMIKEQKKGGDKNSVLTSMLLTKEGYALMMRFCEFEYSAENMLIWTDVMRMKQTYASINAEARKNAFAALWKKYFTAKGEFEVNLPNSLKTKLKKFIEAGKYEDIEGGLKVLFEIEQGVVLNLIDTFSRLEITKGYKKFSQMTETKQRLKSAYL